MTAILLSVIMGVLMITRSIPQSTDHGQGSAGTMVCAIGIGITEPDYGGSEPDIIPDFPLPQLPVKP